MSPIGLWKKEVKSRNVLTWSLLRTSTIHCSRRLKWSERVIRMSWRWMTRTWHISEKTKKCLMTRKRNCDEKCVRRTSCLRNLRSRKRLWHRSVQDLRRSMRLNVTILGFMSNWAKPKPGLNIVHKRSWRSDKYLMTKRCRKMLTKLNVWKRIWSMKSENSLTKKESWKVTSTRWKRKLRRKMMILKRSTWKCKNANWKRVKIPSWKWKWRKFVSRLARSWNGHLSRRNPMTILRILKRLKKILKPPKMPRNGVESNLKGILRRKLMNKWTYSMISALKKPSWKLNKSPSGVPDRKITKSWQCSREFCPTLMGVLKRSKSCLNSWKARMPSLNS